MARNQGIARHRKGKSAPWRRGEEQESPQISLMSADQWGTGTSGNRKRTTEKSKRFFTAYTIRYKIVAHMAHSYPQNHIHLVFSTKDRAKLISKELQPRLWAYVAAICKNHGMLAFAVGGMTDHIHVLFRLPPAITLVRALTLIKSNSSKWIRKKDRKFA